MKKLMLWIAVLSFGTGVIAQDVVVPTQPKSTTDTKQADKVAKTKPVTAPSKTKTATEVKHPKKAGKQTPPIKAEPEIK